jgi:hypothetical protein
MCCADGQCNVPTLGIDAAATLLALVVLLGGPAVALAALLGTAVLVPTTLVVPNTHFSYLTVQHVLAAAALLRLLRSVAIGRIQPRTMWAGPVAAALVLVAATAFIVGLVTSATATYSVTETARLLDIGTQLTFLGVCIVLVEQLASPWLALQIAAGVLLVSAGIGYVEHFSGDAWGQWLFSRLPGHDVTNAAQPLDIRATQPRVRAGAEFALEFAWVSLMLLPAALVTAARSRGGRVAAALAVGFVLASVYWSYSRSALAFGLVCLLLLAIASRDSRIVSVLTIAVVASLVAYQVHPSVTTHLSAATDENSFAVRIQRLHLILVQLAHHPFRGVGLGNLGSTHVATTDNALLLSYAETGALGLTALVVLMVVAIGQTMRAVMVAAESERWVAIACCVGVVTYVVGAQFFDAFTLIQGPQVLWFLVAVATVVARRAGRPVLLPRPAPTVVLGVAAVSVAIAGALVVVVPTHAVADETITTLPAAREAAIYDTINAGKRLMSTACAEAGALAQAHAGVSLTCTPVLFAAGVADVHMTARTKRALIDANNHIFSTIRDAGGIGFLAVHSTGPISTVRDPLWLVPPVLVPVGASALLMLLPWRRRTPGRRSARGRWRVLTPAVT